MEEKRWYLFNGGEFCNYFIRYTNDPDLFPVSDNGGYVDYDTFSDAKAAMISDMRVDIKMAKNNLKEARKLKKESCKEI